MYSNHFYFHLLNFNHDEIIILGNYRYCYLLYCIHVHANGIWASTEREEAKLNDSTIMSYVVSDIGYSLA